MLSSLVQRWGSDYRRWKVRVAAARGHTGFQMLEVERLTG